VCKSTSVSCLIYLILTVANPKCAITCFGALKAYAPVSFVTYLRLTFDCRWYEDNLHGNQDACAAGYTKFVAGACISLVCEFVLLAGIIAFGEIERRRVRSDVVESFKGGMGGFGD